jgi:polysaccharide export outer membrane protein
VKDSLQTIGHIHSRIRGTAFAAICSLLGLGLVLPVEEAQGATRPPAQEAQAEAEGLDQEYRIGPGDVLQLFVWKEPEVSRDITVRVDGKVTVPLLGDIAAAGKTPSQLGAEVTKLLSRFLSAPQVTLSVSVANSTRFYVLGQVAKPGDFPLTGRTTVLQGLALAGGFREFAKTDSIVIIRQDRGFFVPKGRPAESVISFNYKRLEAGRDLAANIVLRPGDTILVP